MRRRRRKGCIMEEKDEQAKLREKKSICVPLTETAGLALPPVPTLTAEVGHVVYTRAPRATWRLLAVINICKKTPRKKHTLPHSQKVLQR